jgi:NADH-ubiquinone oxidoreductase chain 2
LAPIIILSYLISINEITLIFIILSALVGAIGGLNQVSLRKLFAFSSINHIG